MALVFTCKVCVWGGEEQPWHIDYLLSFYTQANEFRMNYTNKQWFWLSRICLKCLKYTDYARCAVTKRELCLL